MLLFFRMQNPALSSSSAAIESHLTPHAHTSVGNFAHLGQFCTQFCTPHAAASPSLSILVLPTSTTRFWILDDCINKTSWLFPVFTVSYVSPHPPIGPTYLPWSCVRCPPTVKYLLTRSRRCEYVPGEKRSFRKSALHWNRRNSLVHASRSSQS